MTKEGLDIEKFVISDLGLMLNFKNLHGLVKEVSNFYLLRMLAAVFNNFGSCVLYFDEFRLGSTKIAFNSLVNQLISFYANFLNR